MKKNYLLLFCMTVLVGCQVTNQKSAPLPSSTAILNPPSTKQPLLTSTRTSKSSAIIGTQQPTETLALVFPAPTSPVEQPLPSFTIDWTKPFADETVTGESITLTNWTSQSYAGGDLSFPFNIDQIGNVHVLDGLTADQKAFLIRNGFVAIHSQEAQFGDIRVETADRTGQPYYLTTDAAYHALHLLFDEMLKAIEREYFLPQMMAVTQATLEQVRTYQPKVKGTPLEAETQQALAYLSVAIKLFDPGMEIDSSVADIVSQQVDQIIAASSQDRSVIFPDFEDDYGAYKPVGHYAGDPELEAYFRGMTWFGRMHFRLVDPENPTFVPSRLPLIVTLALRQAQVDSHPASDTWATMHKALTFIIGPTDDAGPLEYSALMDQVYGNNPQIENLADPSRWQDFLSHRDRLPVPQINSLFVASTMNLTPEKGWRFMGQRFTLDGLIFQNVIYDRVQAKPDKTRRDFPSGLDVMAVFGSSPAYKESDKLGATSFPNYSDQIAKMQQTVKAQPEANWLGTFYDGWLYSFLPVVQSKRAAFPTYMQTSAWSYKDLNTALGSWAELKHDTILYTKMPEGAGGGGPPTSNPAPSYVEPNPATFYRLAYMAHTLSCGLQNIIFHDVCSFQDFGIGVDDASSYISGMGSLGNTFQTLGDIAAKELTGQAITEDDNNVITKCLGLIECTNLVTPYNRPNSEMPKVPIIAAVSGAKDSVLEVGVGNIDRIYVVVPLEGKWEIAQGGVFSYYEFIQPRVQRLTDDEWRQKLAGGKVQQPEWVENFLLLGGQPEESLFFRIGDIYIITEAGDKLNVRDQPSTSSARITQLHTYDYVEIVDGPVQADGYTWWKVANPSDGSVPTGWVVEDQEWYDRSYIP